MSDFLFLCLQHSVVRLVAGLRNENVSALEKKSLPSQMEWGTALHGTVTAGVSETVQRATCLQRGSASWQRWDGGFASEAEGGGSSPLGWEQNRTE